MQCHKSTKFIPGCNKAAEYPPSGSGFCGTRRTQSPTRSPSLSQEPTFTEQPSFFKRDAHGELILYDGECPGTEGTCPVCSAKVGGCKADTDCEGDLRCYKRGKYDVVSGCGGKGIYNVDYCFNPDYEWMPPAIPEPVKPTGGNFYFDHEINMPDKCEIYAADLKEKVMVPFGGKSGMLSESFRVLRTVSS